MTTIAVTGATGFIGQALCRYLVQQGMQVRGLVRSHPLDAVEGVEYRSPGTKWDEADLVTAVRGCDAVVHLAGRAHIMRDTVEDPLEQYRLHNRDLTLWVARAAQEASVPRFLFLSTVKVMGERPGHYFPEQEPNPTDPYGQSKWEAEQGLQELFHPAQDSHCLIFRIPMVYGPGNKGNMMPLLKAATRHLPLPLGATRGKRSLLFSGNLTNAIACALMKTPQPLPALETFFITDGHDLTSGELYDGLCRVVSGKARSFWIPEVLLRLGGRAGSLFKSLTGGSAPISDDIISRLFDEYRFEADHFRERYSWQPPFGQEDAFKMTLDWYRYRKNKPSTSSGPAPDQPG